MRILLLFPMFSLLACSSNTLTLLLFLDPELSESCEEDQITDHNFTGAYVPEPILLPSDWNSDLSVDKSASQVFVQIIEAEGKEGVLVMGGKTFPGLREGQVWTFQHDAYQINHEVNQHSTGYYFSEDKEESSLSTISFDLSSKEPFGSVSVLEQTSGYWSQSDQWGEEADAAGANGDKMPASTYGLVRTNELGNEEGAQNTRDRADCNGADCYLEVDFSCTATQNFTVLETHLPDDGDYSAISGAGQAAGN